MQSADSGPIAPLASESWDLVDALAQSLIDYGIAAGLPYIAVQADLGDGAPMADREGRPYALRMPWIERGRDYWQNRQLALESKFLHAARLLSEPIWFHNGSLSSWRPTHILDVVDCSHVKEQFGIDAALIAPVHLPGGQVGAVVWAATEPLEPEVFQRHAEKMFALAIRFLAAHTELVDARHRKPPVQLTRREAQCVRWAAAGKTTAEIGMILSLSVSTVRFHLRNAGDKFGATTRARLIQMATGLGFLGPEA